MDEETAALIDMLRGTRRAPMRLEAARHLAARRDPDAAPALLDLLEDTNDPRIVPIVTIAVEGLQSLGAVTAPLLLQILDRPADPRRSFMPLLLAAALDREAVPRLIEALDDWQEDVRVNAATQLGALGGEQAYDALLAIVQDKGAPAGLRGVAASALGNLKDARALPVLAALSTSKDPELLAGAIDGLADLRHPAGIPYLEAILERPELDDRTNRAVRLALLAMERYRERE